MNSIKVLITAAGSPTWPQMAKMLKNNGEKEISIIGVDLNVDPTILQYIDKVYYAPRVSDPDYVDVLLDVCRKEKIDVLIPGISQELEVIQSRIEEFKKIEVKVAITEGKTLSIANDKIKLYRFLEQRGFEVPVYRVADSTEDIIKCCYELGYPEKPVCVKISNSAGSRGVRIIDANASRFDSYINEKPNSSSITLEEYVSVLQDADALPPIMIMKYLPGPEYLLDLLADNGKVNYIVGQEVLKLDASTPIKSVVKKNEAVYKQATAIVRQLNLNGNIGFDYRADKEGKLWITEINPRITQSLSLVAASGVDLLYFRIKQLLGEELPEEVNIKYGTTIIRRYSEMFYEQ